jgi:aspartate carbamoyltransferase catalytic subunit
MTHERSLLSASQFNEGELLEDLLTRSTRFNKLLDQRKVESLFARHLGKVMLNIFYEASTRTSFSFRTAAARLGMSIVGTESAGQFSSAVKGESVEDTAQILAGNRPDIIVVRHPENGAVARFAAAATGVPVINGGDGTNEHPTQALLDVYTIKKEFGRLDNLSIAIGGDIRRGRTARSLVQLLGNYQSNDFTFIAPEEQNVDDALLSELNNMPANYSLTDQLTANSLSDVDIVYWTRLQSERGGGEQDPAYSLSPELVSAMRPDAIVMHPLPRLSELPESIDSMPQSRYFQQAQNGMPTRMALLDWCLEA